MTYRGTQLAAALLFFVSMSAAQAALIHSWFDPGGDPFQGTMDDAIGVLREAGVPLEVLEAERDLYENARERCFRREFAPGELIDYMTFGHDRLVQNISVLATGMPENVSPWLTECDVVHDGARWGLVVPDVCGNYSQIVRAGEALFSPELEFLPNWHFGGGFSGLSAGGSSAGSIGGGFGATGFGSLGGGGGGTMVPITSTGVLAPLGEVEIPPTQFPVPPSETPLPPMVVVEIPPGPPNSPGPPTTPPGPPSPPGPPGPPINVPEPSSLLQLAIYLALFASFTPFMRQRRTA